MKEPPLKRIKDFMSLHYREGMPVVLGYSGGVDSTALLSLLLDCFPMDLRVAHFDHAWREESKKEALALQKSIESLGLKFYTQRSDKAVCKEEKAREERYLFFKKVYEEVGAQALILAHQQEDLAETVLKRVCEGAGILSLGGMQPVSFYEGMHLWRPLLSVSRKALLEFNTERKLTPLLDSTNRDPRFLRARMREKIFPDLEKDFGKSIQKSIALLGEDFSLLKSYIQKKLESFLSQVVEGPLGFAVLSDLLISLEPFEKQELIRACLQKRGVRVGREAVRQIIALLESGVFDKRVDVPAGELTVDGGSVFWLAETSEKFWQWEKEPRGGERATTMLRDFLHGRVFYTVSKDEEISFCDYRSLNPSAKKKISSFFSRNKIPAAMRRFFPFIKKKESIICDSFLFNNDLFVRRNEDILTIKLKNISN